jgi:hypothetical protein
VVRKDHPYRDPKGANLTNPSNPTDPTDPAAPLARLRNLPGDQAGWGK